MAMEQHPNKKAAVSPAKPRSRATSSFISNASRTFEWGRRAGRAASNSTTTNENNRAYISGRSRAACSGSVYEQNLYENIPFGINSGHDGRKYYIVRRCCFFSEISARRE